MNEREVHAVAVTVRLSRDLVDWIDAQEGSRAAIVRRAVEELRSRQAPGQAEPGETIRDPLTRSNAQAEAHYRRAEAAFDQTTAHQAGPGF